MLVLFLIQLITTKQLILSQFIFQERSYKPIVAVDQMAVLFELEGSLLHQDSDEARRLRVKQELLKGIVANNT